MNRKYEIAFYDGQKIVADDKAEKEIICDALRWRQIPYASVKKLEAQS